MREIAGQAGLKLWVVQEWLLESGIPPSLYNILKIIFASYSNLSLPFYFQDSWIYGARS